MVTRVKAGKTAQDAFENVTQKVTRKVAESVGPLASEAGKTARRAYDQGRHGLAAHGL